MMGPTHALGGAAALAAYTVATGDERVSLLAFGLAALSALIPDSDLEASKINQFPLAIAKWMVLPIWFNGLRLHNSHGQFNPKFGRPPHRGRTHSLPFLALYVAIVAFWLWLLQVVAIAVGHPLYAPEVAYRALLFAAGIGYASHLVLDLLNISPGERLLWPLPLTFVFPPTGRFGANSTRAHLLIHLPLTAFLIWYAASYWGIISATTRADSLSSGLISVAIGVVSVLIAAFWNLLHWMNTWTSSA
jgi:membrane-bound metal-dependent hydrolase YbcI (DUF457 family)